MAVYKRSYKTYTGALTPLAHRWRVITRFSWGQAYALRGSTILTVVCFIPALVFATIVYVLNSETAMMLLELQKGPRLLQIDGKFFLSMLQTQGWLALFLTAWLGPVMVSGDLTYGALPLFLSRPISRAEYVFGKFAVLAGIVSMVTLIPQVLIFLLQASLADDWLAQNYKLLPGLVLGGLIWIALLGLVALAVSAFVKWRIIATGLMVALFFVPAGFGMVANEILNTNLGHLLNIPYMISNVWGALMGNPVVHRHTLPLPLWEAWAGLGGICAAALFTLNTRLRAREVVRG